MTSSFDPPKDRPKDPPEASPPPKESSASSKSKGSAGLAAGVGNGGFESSTKSLSPPAPPTVWRETWTVFRHEIRRFLLSPRTLWPMLVFAGFGALSMSIFAFVSEQALNEAARQGISREDLAEQGEAVVAALLQFSGWGNEGDAAEIFRDQVPLLILFFFVVASYFLPLLVAMVSFDQFSELSTRGARFALLRVRRGTYLAGKALAAGGSVSVFLLLMWLLVMGVSVYRGDPLGISLREALRAWVLMSILALPYLSLTAFISAWVRPGLAFLGTVAAWIGLSVGSTTLGFIIPSILTARGSEEAARQVKRLLVIFPWEHSTSLVSRHSLTVLKGVFPLLILAALGYVATYALVRRRDV